MGKLVDFFASPPTGTEPPTEAQAPSPARSDLARHYAALAAADAAVAPLRAPALALAEAEQREAEAQGAVDAVALAEEAALEIWATAPNAPLPPPRAEEREQALAHLADAHAAAVAARRTAAAVAPALEKAHLAYCEIASKTPDLIRAAELETAAALAEQYAHTMRRALAIESVLLGLIDERRTNDDGAGMTLIRRWMVAGPDVPTAEYQRLQHFDCYRRQTLALCQRHRAAGHALADRLGRDPQATIQIDDDAAPRRASESAA